jgi:PPP family 3-phenylpropionic acid transporter
MGISETETAKIGRGGIALAITSATYSLLRAGPGALSPFFGLWLKAKGFTAAEIGVIIAAPLFGRLVLAPGLGIWANRYLRLRTPLIMLCLAAGAAAFALMIVRGFWPVLFAWSIACICEGVCTPLLDVATLKTAARSGFAFSTPRAAAASAAIVSGVALGALFAAYGPGVLPVWSLIGLLFTAAFIGLFLTAEHGPQTPSREGLQSEFGGGDPMAPALLIMIISAAGLIQLSHGMNGMAMLGWRARGISEAWCGVLWQTGTVADIAFLWVLSRFSIAPSRLLMLGGLGAAARWAIFALSPPIALLFLAQTLHALSFTATYIATVQLIDRLVADRGKLLAQSLYWAISTGLCTGVGVVGGGLLYQWAGNNGYWAMCALAFVGFASAGFVHVCLQGRLYRRVAHRRSAYAK